MSHPLSTQHSGCRGHPWSRRCLRARGVQSGPTPWPPAFAVGTQRCAAGNPVCAGTAGCGELELGQQPCTGARGPAVPGAGPIAHHTGQALPTAPSGEPAMEASAWVPSRSSAEKLLQMSSAEKKRPGGHRGDFPGGGQGNEKEGGCPSQLIAAWHLCPRAAIQVCREQARCHCSRWARRQAAPGSQPCHSSGRGGGCLGQISQLRMSKQLPVWSLYTYN